MANSLLKVRQLTVNVEDKEILHQVDLDIATGETHVLMGPNGAGKSTLGYDVTGGSVLFDGSDLLDMTADQRAKAGLFLSFQNPLEVPGITLGNFIRNAVEQRTGERVRLWNFRKQLEKECEILDMDPSYVDRDLNVGFSGGEKKKAEILQLLMLKPKLAILDETDSGLDVDAVRTVSKGVEEYQKQEDGALLIITHNTGILSSLKVDRTHVLVNGQVVGGGDASLVDEINRDGYEKYEAKAAE